MTAIPYIKQDRRKELDAKMHDFADVQYWTPGDVAYVVYRIMREYTRNSSFLGFATIVGAVLLSVARFVQKVVMTYEDQKERENGGIE